MQRLERTRAALADFLRTRRARLSPEDVGLPGGGRRRTAGLRREEVAALAGVGVTWYTWLEQGRDIGVSTACLDNLARVLKLDEAERRHLFLLAQARPPAAPGQTWCVLPPLVNRLMHDLPHVAFVLNLRWDVLGSNAQADTLFGFDRHAPARRNLLWLLFTDPGLRSRVHHWDEQAPLMLSSFRRDFVRATPESDIHALVEELGRVSPDFRARWRRHDVHAPCTGIRHLITDGRAEPWGHTSLTLDEERHLRLVVYMRLPPVNSACT